MSTQALMDRLQHVMATYHQLPRLDSWDVDAATLFCKNATRVELVKFLIEQGGRVYAIESLKEDGETPMWSVYLADRRYNLTALCLGGKWDDVEGMLALVECGMEINTCKELMSIVQEQLVEESTAEG